MVDDQSQAGPPPSGAGFTRRGVLAGAGASAVALAAGFGIGRVTADDDGGSSRAAFRKVKIDRTPVQPLPRSQHATAVLDGNLVLCIGGNGIGGSLASCQVFDPAKDEWYDASPLASPRALHSATPLQDGRILVLGGLDGSALAIASIFDPADNSWTRGKPLASPRYDHAATALPDGRVVLTGGFNVGPLAGAEIYDPKE